MRLAYITRNGKLKFAVAFLGVYDWSVTLIEVILLIVLIVDFRSCIVIIPLIL